MCKRGFWLAGVAGLALSLTTGIAVAESTMQELLKSLHENGTIDDPTYQRLKAAAAEEGKTESGTAVRAEFEPAPEPEPEPAPQISSDVSTKGGLLKFSSPQGDYQFQIGGRIQVEAAAYDADKQELGNGTELRRARMFLAGKINDIWGFKSEFDFSSGDFNIQDVYLRNTRFPWAITLGYFKEYIALQQQTSDKYLTFMERSLPDAFFPGRNLGIGLTNGGDTWSAAAGVFGEGFNDNNDTPGKEQDEGYGTTGRLTWAPFGGGDRVLHLGAAASYREINNSKSLRYRTRPETHVTNVRLVDTGNIADTDSRNLYSLEAATVVGPWSTQGEYFLASADRRGASDLDFNGWYFQTAYVLTGESRNYNPSAGRFGRFKPARPVGDGGPGAWQVAARISEVDLTDGGIDGGRERNLTLGLNWFLEPTLRLSFNYVNALDVDGGPNNGDEPSSYQARAYIDF